MTVEEALKTCTGFVNYEDLKGHFSFEATNVLLGTGRFELYQCSWMGYVLRRLTPEQQEERRQKQERAKYGGALDWLKE